MKVKHFLFLFSVMMLAACQPTLDFVDVPDTGSLSADSDSVAIKFTTNQDWRVEIDKPWLSVDQLSGKKGVNKILVTAQENPDYETREGRVTITAGEIVKEFKFVQKEMLGVVADVTDFVCPDDEGTIQIPVKANTDIKVTIEDKAKDWIQFVQTKALQNKDIELKLKPNETFEPRVGRVSIAAGRDIRNITITQVEKAGLLANKLTFDANPEGASISIPLKTNVDYDVEIVEGGDWISIIDRGRYKTKALIDYNMVVKVELNNTYSDRKGVVRLTSVAGTLDFVIDQAHIPEIFADDVYEVGPEPGILTIPFESTSGDFVATVVEGEDWLSCVQTKGLSSHNIVLSYTSSPVSLIVEKRAVLRIESDGISREITIIQKHFTSTLNDVEYVDLGLPSGVLWANENIGASSPLSAGQYFQWGTRYGYYADNFKDMDEASYLGKIEWYKDTYPFLEALNDEVGNLPFDFDAVSHWLGEGTRIPTAEDYQELYNNCTFEECETEDGKNYIKAVSNINGKSIIFPYGGRYAEDHFIGVNEDACYWTCFSYDLYNNVGEFVGLMGGVLIPGNPVLWGTHRAVAMPIRPVYAPDVRATLKLDSLSTNIDGPLFKYSVLMETNSIERKIKTQKCEIYEVDEQGEENYLGYCGGLSGDELTSMRVYDRWCGGYYPKEGSNEITLGYEKTYAVRAVVTDDLNRKRYSNFIHFTTPAPDVEVKFTETQLYNGNNIYVKASTKSETMTIEEGGFIIEKLDASNGEWNYLRHETARLIEWGDEFIFQMNFEQLESNTTYRIAAFVDSDNGKRWASDYLQYTTLYVPEVLVALDKAEFVAPDKIHMEGIAYSEDPKYPLTEVGFEIEKMAVDGRWESVETYYVEDIQGPRFSYDFECDYNSVYSIRSFGSITRDKLNLEDFWSGQWYSDPQTVSTGSEYKEPIIILSDLKMSRETIELSATIQNNNVVDEYPVLKTGFVYEAYVDGRKTDEVTLEASLNGNSIMGEIKPIIPGAVYKVKAFVTNKVGTYYSDTKEYVVETYKAPAVTLSDLTFERDQIVLYAAIKNVNSVDEYPILKSGFTYEAFLNGRKVDEATLEVAPYVNNTILAGINQYIPGALYKVRAFVTDKVGTYYSDIKEYVVEIQEYEEPDITLADPAFQGTEIALSATIKNNNSGDEYPILSSGFTYEAVVNGQRADQGTLEASLYETASNVYSITSSIRQVIPGAVYIIRAFATDSEGTYYSDSKDILIEVTNSISVEMTSDLISPATTVDCYVSGKVTPADYSVVDAVGAVWGKEKNPTLTQGNQWSMSQFNPDGGTFDAWVYSANLAPGTYYIRLYATGKDGTTVYSSRQLTLTKQ